MRQKRCVFELYTYLSALKLNTISQLEWGRYLSGTMRSPIGGSDAVYVQFPQYMEQLGHLMDSYHPRVVHNAVLLRFR